ncbi:hypothetical protein O4J56_03155 [Nocardiopsis sp. RSe5-2]|uniref:Secreted protein n=1 Tax=Nocardiopsis endophytica TaxID=3018445 RepID=A0ABT4TZG4_9ACTN|nr:hypothetical protein [Nocardiopsis endophytica]MDA2809629.1 hypothetical protein [Nocardiopsis endophytica]
MPSPQAATAVLLFALMTTAAGCGASGGGGGGSASPTPSSSPSASPSPPAGQEVEYRALTVTVPEDWEVRSREDDFSSPGDTDLGSEEWKALVPGECEADRLNWGNADDAPCPHVKVLGPKAISQAGHGAPLDPDGAAFPYDPSTNPAPCPMSVETRETEFPPPEEDTAYTTRPVGAKKAAYAEVEALCIDPENSTAADGRPLMRGYDQRYWFLPESEILIVDNYGIEEMDDILAGGHLE